MAENGDADKAEGSTPKRQRAEGDEWTRSDSRGPLGAADAESDAKREMPEAPPAETAASGPSSTPTVPSDASTDPPEAAAPEAEDEKPAAEPQRHTVPVLPIIAALVVGAVIGAASAAVVYKTTDQGAGQADVNALASRVDALEKRPDPQPELDRLKASLDKASTTAQAQDPSQLQQKLANLETEVDGLKTQGGGQALAEKVTALEGGVDALKKQNADQGLADKVGALEGSVNGLKTQGADLKGLGDKVSGLASAVDALKKEDATATAGIAALQSGQKALEGKAGAPALAVVADSLVAAIAHGKPYASQVDAAASLGADPAKVAVLRENAEKGVPSAQALAQKFAPLADSITATANRAPANAGLVDRLKSGMLSMVSIRRADGSGGDDPGSRVSRIEADLTHDDVDGAYATWEGLQAEAKARSEAWGALAKTHVAAMAAARALQQQAIAALGGKKS